MGFTAAWEIGTDYYLSHDQVCFQIEISVSLTLKFGHIVELSISQLAICCKNQL